jgi:L-lactate dehydrogenase complex protein LldG
MTAPATSQADHLYAQFEAALVAVGGSCSRVGNTSEAATTIAELAKGPIWTAPMVRDTLPGLMSSLATSGIEIRFADNAVDVRDQPIGLSVARQAIAETGSVVLVERMLPDRSVGLMTELHIVICTLDTLAPTLDDAGETLAAVATEHGSYATLVTGPSRTADIERQLTVGVQGPARLHVLFIDHTS